MSKPGIPGSAAVSATSFATLVKPVDETFNFPREGRRKSGFSLARLQAELQEVKAEAALEGREEGYQEGYSFGRKVGMRNGQAEALAEGRALNEAQIAEFVAELDQIGESFHAATQRWFQSVEQSLESLAVVIAERILAQELKLNPDAIRGLAQECLAEVTHATDARIRVNSAAYAALHGHQAQLQSIAPSLKHLELIEDPNLTDGVVIDTEGGRVDGLIATRIRAMFEGLEDAA